MADEHLGPDTLSTRGLPTSRRGYEKKAVEALIARAIEAWDDLQRRHEALMAEVARSGGEQHLARDVTAVAEEVGKVLQAAQEAADGMRTRAREDAQRVDAESAAAAARVVAEATEEAARILEEARKQAFEVRRDAWDTGSMLIESAGDAADEAMAGAVEEAMGFRAEAEREAHQRITIARKEADDIVRGARFEADRQVNQARELARRILEQVDVEEGSTEARQVADEVERISSQRSIEDVKVLPAGTAPPPRRAPEPAPEPEEEPAPLEDLSDSLAEDVQMLRETPAPPSRLPRPAADQTTEQFDVVGTLFESLRTTAEIEPVTDLPGDPASLRDRLVLPVQNEGLRDVKRRIVDLQGTALSKLDAGSWSPDAARISSELTAVLQAPLRKAARAGATAAQALSGVVSTRPEPGTRAAGLVGEMARDLAAQLRAAASGEGGGKDVASTVKRVFRAWRSDEAERWVRAAVSSAYHDAMLAALAEGGVDMVVGVPSGRPCSSCAGYDRTTWHPGAEPPAGRRVPPADLDCLCTLTSTGE